MLKTMPNTKNDRSPAAQITRLTERMLRLVESAPNMTDDQIGDEFALIAERLAYNVGKLTKESEQSGYTLDYESITGAAFRAAICAAKEDEPNAQN